MNEDHVTKFFVSFSGHIQQINFPAGVFDDEIYLIFDILWGPDWDPITGLCSGTTQTARAGTDPERVVFNMPVEMTLGSTNVYGWPQMVVTVRAKNPLVGDCVRGYALFLLPPTVGTHVLTAALVRPRSATVLGEWLAWLTGRNPELVDPKMLASGKENYLMRTTAYGTVTLRMTMVSKDLRKLGYDNQPLNGN